MTTDTFDAAWLMAQKFPPIEYVVPGVIPEGMSILVAAPKIGKSWLVLGLGVALSTGAAALGALPVGPARPVLYMALEDGPRRLQDRLLRLAPPTISPLLEFRVNVTSGELLTTIGEFMSTHRGRAPVVILDTLGKVMPPAGNASQYGHDYRVLSSLKGTCDAVPGSSLIIVHHTRKGGGEDFLDAVSGTQGIAGAADTVMVLRRERNDDRATLHVTSRDAAEGEYSLLLTESGSWELDGRDLLEAAKAAQTAKQTAGVGDRMADVIETVSRFPEGIKPSDVKTLMQGVAGIDEYLRRAVDAGRIIKLGRGLYAPVRSVSSVSFEERSHTSHTTNTLLTGDAGA